MQNINIVFNNLLTNPHFPNVIEGLIAVIFLFFIIISVILLYHWKKYESGNKKMFFVTIIYFGVSGILLSGLSYYLFLLIK